MDPSSDWIQLSNSYYKLFEFFKMDSEFKSIELNHSLIAMARFGGPLAITRDPNHVVLSKADDPTKENICLYQNNGELMFSFPNKEEGYNKREARREDGGGRREEGGGRREDGGRRREEGVKIVCFDFIQEELLLVLFSNGAYYLIDPLLRKKSSKSLGSRFEEDGRRIVSGRVCENGLVFMNSEYQFFYVKNVFEPHVAKFADAGVKWGISRREEGGGGGRREEGGGKREDGGGRREELGARGLEDGREGGGRREDGGGRREEGIAGQWVPFFLPLPASHSLSERIELHLTHPEAGVVVLAEDESRRVYYNASVRDNIAAENLPHVPEVWMFAFSQDYKLMGMLTRQLYLHVVNADFSISSPRPPILISTSKPKQLLFCQNDCIILTGTRTLELVNIPSQEEGGGIIGGGRREEGGGRREEGGGRREEGGGRREEGGGRRDDGGRMVNEVISLGGKGCWAFGEVDGVKIVSNAKCEMLRKLPDAYVSVFRLLSFDPGALLYEAYTSFENRSPLPDEDIRNKKAELAKGVQDCIDAGGFELTAEIASKLLKAAAYGKAFLGGGGVDHNMLAQVCKHLRVVHNIKSELKFRTITYAQIKSMEPSVLIKILLRYRAHFLAYEVCKFLYYHDKLRSLIYVDWAKCKIEQNDSDDAISNAIREKLKDEKGISYTEIAQKAIELGKNDLAIKLLVYEPSISKKVPIVLWMEKYEKALEDAVESRDSNLIYMVILKLIKVSGKEPSYIYDLLSKSPTTQSHLLLYLKSFSPEGLVKYLKHLNAYEELGLTTIRDAYFAQKQGKNEDNRRKELEKRYNVLEMAAKFLKTSADAFLFNMTADQVEVMKEITNSNSDSPVEKPVTEMLDKFLAKKEVNMALEFKKIFKIPDRRFNILRIKNLILQKDYEKLDTILNEVNRKSPVLPWEFVAELLFEVGNPELAEKYLGKVTDIEEQVNYLKTLGRLRRAVEVCKLAKRGDLLEEMRGNVDAELMGEIDLFLMGGGAK